jgi:colicin import membrane protein
VSLSIPRPGLEAPAFSGRSRNAYALSATLHAIIAAIAVALAYFAGRPPPSAPETFDVVAGAGDNYGATVAPALGLPGGIKLNIPTVAPPETPSPEEALPTPDFSAVSIVTAPPTPAPKAASTTNFSKVVQRAAARRAARLEAKYRKQLEAEKRRQISYEQYQREHAGSQSSRSAVSQIDAEGLREGVVGGSTENKVGGAGGKALTREEGTLIEAYFAALKSRLHESFDEIKPTDVSNSLSAQVAFVVGADGTIYDIHFLRTSGNAEFDQAVRDAFRRTASLGPRPDHRTDEVQTEFNMTEDDASGGG